MPGLPVAPHPASLMVIDTPRACLRHWRGAEREVFAAMDADPEMMLDLGGPMSRATSDAKLDRYVATFHRHGICRVAVESRGGAFQGYVGIMPSSENNPLGPYFDIGWRLTRNAWDRGYATAAAGAA